MNTKHGTPRARGVRDGLGVVARAAADNAGGARVAQRGQLRQRAADLE
jgi:hypothetical protein